MKHAKGEREGRKTKVEKCRWRPVLIYRRCCLLRDHLRLHGDVHRWDCGQQCVELTAPSPWRLEMRPGLFFGGGGVAGSFLSLSLCFSPMQTSLWPPLFLSLSLPCCGFTPCHHIRVDSSNHCAERTGCKTWQDWQLGSTHTFHFPLPADRLAYTLHMYTQRYTAAQPSTHTYNTPWRVGVLEQRFPACVTLNMPSLR